MKVKAISIGPKNVMWNHEVKQAHFLEQNPVHRGWTHCAAKTCHLPRAHCHLQQEQQRRGGGRKKREKERNPDILYWRQLDSIYIQWKWFIFFKRQQSGVGERKEEKWSVRPLRKEVWNALNYSPLRWLISIEAPGQSGSFSMWFSFHLNRNGGAQLKAYQFVSKSTPIKVVTSNKTIIIATRLCH